MASRRRWLRWEVAVTLAAAAGGAAAGYWAAPAYLRHPTGAGDRAAFMGVVALGLVTGTGIDAAVGNAHDRARGQLGNPGSLG
jgi:hypothetical protein